MVISVEIIQENMTAKGEGGRERERGRGEGDTLTMIKQLKKKCGYISESYSRKYERGWRGQGSEGGEVETQKEREGGGRETVREGGAFIRRPTGLLLQTIRILHKISFCANSKLKFSQEGKTAFGSN